jgi:hypothetical protein
MIGLKHKFLKTIAGHRLTLRILLDYGRRLANEKSRGIQRLPFCYQDPFKARFFHSSDRKTCHKEIDFSFGL